MLLAAITLRADLVELPVVPAVALEAADVVVAPLAVDARCQSLDAQVEGHDAIIAHGACLLLFPPLVRLVPIVCDTLLRIVVHERAGVVPARIPLDTATSSKVLRGRFGEMRDDVGEAFGSPIASATCREDNWCCP